MVETTKGRFLVVEVKSHREKEGYEKNKQEYKGKIDNLFSEVFAKEIGFKEFQQANKNFEYRIIFDASLSPSFAFSIRVFGSIMYNDFRTLVMK